MQEPLNHRAKRGSQAWDSEDWQEFFAEEARPGGRVGEHRQAPGEPAQPLRPVGAVLATARCRAVLAEVLSARGQHAQAEEMHKSGIAEVENLAGPQHPQAGRSLRGLAELYLGLARYGDAAPLLERAYALSREASGDAHPDVALSLLQLAECRRGQGRFDECESAYLQALSSLESTFGSEHFLVARVKIALGCLWSYLGRFDKADKVYAEAMALRSRLASFDHPASSQTLAGLAELALCLGRLVDAEQLALDAISVANGPPVLSPAASDAPGLGSAAAAELEFTGAACRPAVRRWPTGQERQINKQEAQVLKMTAAGCDAGEISRTLDMSPGAVRAAIGSLLAKLASVPAQAAQVKLYNLIAR